MTMNIQTSNNMFTPSTAGRLIGALFLIQMAVGIYINFALIPTLSWAPGATLAEPPSTLKFGLVSLLALVVSSFNLIIASISYQIFSRYNPVHALLVVAISGVALALTGVEYARFQE